MVPRDPERTQTQSTHTGSHAHTSEAHQPRHKKPLAAESTPPYPYQASPPQNLRLPPQPNPRSTRQEPDLKPLDSVQDHMPNSRSNFPSQIHRSSTSPAEPHPQLQASSQR